MLLDPCQASVKYTIMYYKSSHKIAIRKGSDGKQIGQFGGNNTLTRAQMEVFAREAIGLIQKGQLQEQDVKTWGSDKIWNKK